MTNLTFGLAGHLWAYGLLKCEYLSLSSKAFSFEDILIPGGIFSDCIGDLLTKMAKLEVVLGESTADLVLLVMETDLFG